MTKGLEALENVRRDINIHNNAADDFEYLGIIEKELKKFEKLKIIINKELDKLKKSQNDIMNNYYFDADDDIQFDINKSKITLLERLKEVLEND